MWINTGANFAKESHGGFLSKLQTTGATYQNNVDKYRGYLCQTKPWGLPNLIVNNGGYLYQMKPWELPKQIGNNGGYLWQPMPTKVMGAFCM